MMMATTQPMGGVNPKTGMTHDEMREFVRNQFEQFVNRKNLNIGNVNFAPEFVDHGSDVPPGTPPGPAGAIQYIGGAYKKFPNIHVEILDMVAEDDKVVVQNRWTGTEAATASMMPRKAPTHQVAITPHAIPGKVGDCVPKMGE